LPAERKSGWGSRKISLRQPVFNATTFETQVLMQEGQTVLLGSSSSPDGKWVYVGFLTVK
jgi:hypothetical protein